MRLARTATRKVEGGRVLLKKKQSFYEQMTRRQWVLMFKNGSGEINTHQKEQQRNKKGIERAEGGDSDGVTSKAPLKPFKVALRLGKRGL